MTKIRLIPVVFIRNGSVVQSKGFHRYQRIGLPVAVTRRLSDWASDELVVLDITREGRNDIGRDDLNAPNPQDTLGVLEQVAEQCFMPLTFGGGIRTLDDVRARLRRGADKITLNTLALEDPDSINAAARTFGSQCVVVSVDVREDPELGWRVFSESGRAATGWSATAWARECARRGAGELLVNSIDRDGKSCGYDTQLLGDVVGAVDVPVVALGGVGKWDDLVDGVTKGGASAVAAGNIFHYSENSVYNAKRHLFEAGIDVREPELRTEWGE
jgi:cyclase